MESFVYDIPTKVYFGKDSVEKVGELVAAFNPKKVLIHYGGGSAIKSGLLDKVKASLEKSGLAYIELGGVKPNPELSLVKQGIALATKEGVDFVLAVGGGSVLDSAKGIANGVANPDIDVWDFSIGKQKLCKTLHKGAILTLSAAGSEMSNSSVITNEITHEKRGFGSQCNRFDFAIENPELTYTVSPYQTACGIVDIAMHSSERFFGIGEDTPLTDRLALSVIKTTFEVGSRCLKDPQDYGARANMMWCSSISHNGLTGCGRNFVMPVHQLEHELSGLYPSIAHGAGLAALWASWARYVYSYCPERFLVYGKEIWGVEGSDENAILEGISRQEAYYRDIGMPTSLEELGIQESDLPLLASGCSRQHTRVIPGYKPLDEEDMLAIYKMAFKRK